VIEHGTNGHEFTLLVEWGGMAPAAAIQAGTLNAAKLLGWEKNAGSLERGKWADVSPSPATHARHPRHGARVVRHEGREIYKQASVAVVP
jgi:imidazolonepropionase-like amidohydrolase